MQSSFDTPTKASSASMAASNEPTRLSDVQNAVRKDLVRKVALTDGNDFLDKILGTNVDSNIIKKIEDGLYDGRRWQGFPQPLKKKKHEVDFYKPFVYVSNFIHHCFPSNKRTPGRWVDIHTKSPTATAEFVAQIRPDCTFVSNPNIVGEAIDAFESRADQLSDSKQIDENAEIWWRHMIVVVEVKREDKHLSGSFPQLCGYARQMLRQQLDRRFVLGITVSFNLISVWSFDRSGALGMTEPFNFHDKPRKFIRLIAGISQLPSHRLGWDPTMKLYNPRTQLFEESYRLRASLGLKREELDVLKSQWLLTLVDNRYGSRSSQKHYEIFLHQALLLRTAEGMNGRAVQVHLGYEKQHMEKKRRHPIAVKSSWQPVSKIRGNEPVEAYHYSLIPELKDRVFAASIVEAGHGLNIKDNQRVSTFEYIRRGATPNFQAGQAENNIGKKLSRGKDLDEFAESMAYMAFAEPSGKEKEKDSFFAEDKLDVTDRVHTRLALNVYGWPIKFFTDLRELLNGFKGAIKDHQKMYKSGVLHRDISLGNILLQPLQPDSSDSVREMVSNTEGVLIDLDHAKVSFEKSTVAPQKNLESLSPARRGMDSAEAGISENTFSRAWRFHPDPFIAAPYAAAAKRLNVLRSNTKGIWSSKDLGWKDVGEVPDFSGHQPQVPERTGTLPFMSYKLLKKKYPVRHEVIHDLESFLWVLVYLCLTRQSGGGHKPKKPTSKLKEMVQDLFESERLNDLYVTKSEILNNETHFENMLDQIHAYFKPLKTLLRRWRDVLLLGYQYKAYEYYLIHDYVLRFIDDALEELDFPVEEEQETPPEDQTTFTDNALKGQDSPVEEEEQTPPTDVIENELQRRIKEYASLCNLDTGTPIGIPTGTAQSTQASMIASGGMSLPSPERVWLPASSKATPSSDTLEPPSFTDSTQLSQDSRAVPTTSDDPFLISQTSHRSLTSFTATSSTTPPSAMVHTNSRHPYYTLPTTSGDLSLPSQRAPFSSSATTRTTPSALPSVAVPTGSQQPYQAVSTMSSDLPSQRPPLSSTVSARATPSNAPPSMAIPTGSRQPYQVPTTSGGSLPPPHQRSQHPQSSSATMAIAMGRATGSTSTNPPVAVPTNRPPYQAPSRSATTATSTSTTSTPNQSAPAAPPLFFPNKPPKSKK